MECTSPNLPEFILFTALAINVVSIFTLIKELTAIPSFIFSGDW
jgi:hypothetical protein